MAEDNEDFENDDGEDNSPKAKSSGKLKIIIIVLVALLLVAGTVGGTLYMLGFFEGGSTTEEQNESEEGDNEAVVEKPKSAMYYPIKPAFTVNFPSKGRQRYLQVDVTVLTRDMDAYSALQTHSPLVKNRLVMLFSGEIYEELQTHEGKELLRQKSLEALQGIMQQEIGKPGVEDVLFTNFVMQ